MENFVVCVFRSVLVLSDSYRGVSRLLPGGCRSHRQALELKGGRREGAAGGALVSALSVQTFAAPPDLTTAVLPSAVLESRESSF